MIDIFLPVLSITCISGLLAILISLAEKRLNNYGVCKLDINNGEKILEVEGGSSLLTTLASQKIFIPSACGGKATCGLCKIQVMSGAGPLLPTEEPYLSAAERADHYRLSCQLKVKTNMFLHIPEELFNIREFVTTVESIVDLTHDIKAVRLALAQDDTAVFKAGQFMQFYSEPYAKVKESVFRAYSISSPPSDKNHFEFVIRQVPDGICTTYVHQALKVGDRVRLSGPYGDFYLRGNCSELIMIAGGSGLAPIRSLLYDIIEKDLQYDIRFFFGASTERDLYYLDEFAELEKRYPRFKFIPCVSSPDENSPLQVQAGRVTDVLSAQLEGAEDKEAYLCGSPGMLNAAVQILYSKGFTDEKIFFDKF